MSQPPSLPKLTAFLRPGQQQQTPAGDDNFADKRRLDHHAAPHPPQMYAHEGSELLHEAHRQKRRANVFVQYRDTEYHPSQQQHHPLQRSVDYDPRLHAPPPQHTFLPPPNAQAMGQYAHAPSLVDPRRQPPAAFRDFPGNAYGAPMAMQDTHHAHAVKNEMPPPSASPEPIQRERKSRYLSESDRRSIITRIDHGEKQVALAKEYQVSRAAICNLYKNRKEVLTRAERDARPKQAKRAKSPNEEKHTPGESRGATATASEASAEDKGMSDRDDDAMSDDNASSTDSNDTNPATAVGSSSPSIATHREASGPPVRVVPVYDASTSSYPIRGLVSELRNAQLPQATLRQVTSRLVRCLLEETLACLPRQEANVMTSAGDPIVCLQPIDVDQTYAISMESQGSIMLQALLDILPSAATALVSTTLQKDSLREEWVVNCPRLLQIPVDTSVLLLAVDCATGTQLVSVLTYLVDVAHVKQSNIYVAIVISSEPGLALVHERFPGVTVVSAAIDHGLDEQGRIRPGLGNLMERFLHLDVSERSRS